MRDFVILFKLDSMKMISIPRFSFQTAFGTTKKCFSMWKEKKNYDIPVLNIITKFIFGRKNRNPFKKT